MIRDTVVAEVRRLLFVERLSQRQVAARLGVSRGSVHAIARGKRQLLREPAEEEAAPVGPPRRCPECGGLVYMPCLLCRARAIRGTNGSARRAG